MLTFQTMEINVQETVVSFHRKQYFETGTVFLVNHYTSAAGNFYLIQINKQKLLIPNMIIQTPGSYLSVTKIMCMHLFSILVYAHLLIVFLFQNWHSKHLFVKTRG